LVADGTWGDTAAYIKEAKIAKNLVPGYSRDERNPTMHVQIDTSHI
jgi:hypothetical protein